LAALEPITHLATGTISVRLYKGDLYFDTADDAPESMPHSIFTEDSSMEAEGSYDHVDAEGFMRVLGVSAKNLGNRQFRDLGR
jgi:argininosuccinate synthase